ncbi:hypothetical protein [Rhizobium tropici]|uniref:Uncharacterized protein n=1 Tax=Rhizobium tropici TaxID=398 RepID=A0A329Y7F2_RHITR|nr:hypothetical protein [Rhizobium tropici]RAX37832.1 hypothetical protein DQ393_29510 [Rhizobium tropici]
MNVTLTVPERVALFELFDSCPDNDTIEEVFYTIQVSLHDITEPKKKPLVIQRCLTYLQEDHKKCCAIAKELCKRFSQNPSVAAVQQLIARLERPIPATLADVILIDIKVIIDRTHLRGTLEDIIVHGFPRPVIGVSGPRKAGRTHSWHLIRHVADENGIQRIKLDLKAWIAEEQTLESLVDRIVEKAQLTDFAAKNCIGVTPEVKGQRYATALAEALAERPPRQRLWLVFDSVDQRVDPAIGPFIKALCEAACDNVFTNCTIFVLGWGPDFELSNAFKPRIEQLSEFLPFELTAAAEAINKIGNPPLNAAVLQQRVDRIHAAARSSLWPDNVPDIERLLLALGEEVRIL